jgi:UPF0176 protein
MASQSTTYFNISGYLFADLTELKHWRAHLLDQCKAHQLKGTILLSTEGINLFLAGLREDIDLLISEVQKIPGLEKFRAKFSESDHQPFNRMLVRIKKEIISFGVDAVKPAHYTSRHLPAATLKQWLDEGRPITLLDTRNDYEVKLGTFRNALPIKIDHFRQFPDAVRQLPEEMKKQPIVTFCTGGIRCEKAAPFMEMEGFENIYQLDGGILKYFEEVGGDHYDGECFVFDHRVGLDPSLRETPSAVCFRCQAPLDEDDQLDSRFVEGESCPYCFKTDEQKMHDTLIKRHALLKKITNPLPGAEPYHNLRPFSIKENYDGQTLLQVLTAVFPQVPEEEWCRRLDGGRFRLMRGGIAHRDQVVRAGQRFEQTMDISGEPVVNADIKILFEDSAIVVIHKPAPLPMHACGRFHRNTLQFIINKVVHPAPRPVHRLDANTSGLVIFGRTRHFAAALSRQLLQDRWEKIYLVRVQGSPTWDSLVCELPITSQPAIAGSREVDEENGLPCRTDFRVLHRYDDHSTLLEARLHTGRTNQIRVHLWQLELPVRGDATYLSGKLLGDRQTLDVDMDPLCLHAWQVSFDHPIDGRRLTFEADKPDWALVP